ncbi:hypothetical protein NRF22_03810 [Oenococcus kitaharae]|uniref:hypothetical protein n=1 Tax=Oenococcus TaxID=46254 RepID=UPI0021E88198|nr:hypothetical protein [Oenococcus kitaharae]MCV3296239.1 hypothetical protein [Oenococcus kitaharae]
MANSRKLDKGWLFNDRYIGLSLEAKAALPLLFDRTDDLGIIQSPLSALHTYDLPESVIAEIEQAGYIKEFNFDDQTYYYFFEWNQHLQYFALVGMDNPFLMANLFIGANGKTVFKDHRDNQNHDYVTKHKLLISKIYKPSSDFRALASWLDDNEIELTKPMVAKLRQISSPKKKLNKSRQTQSESP